MISNARLSQILSLTIGHQHQVLVSGGADRTIKLWDLATEGKREPKHILEVHAGQVRSVVFSPDGKLLASAGNDLEIKLWKMSD